MNRIIDQSPQWDSQGIYSRECVFRVEQYKKVRMFFLIFDITPSFANTDYVIPTSPFLIDRVTLESDNNPIAVLSTLSILGSIDQQPKNRYDQIISGSTFNDPFSTEQRISLPLFFWVYDTNQVLDTDLYNNLTIRMTTKSSFIEMGFDASLLNMNVQLRTMYYMEDVPRPLDFSKAYNHYSQLTYPIVASASGTVTEKVIDLNVPFVVTDLMFFITDNTDAENQALINKIELQRTNGERNVYESATNYFLSEDSNVSSSVFQIQLKGSEHFNEQRGPVRATISYTNLSSNGTLFVSYKYRAKIVENGNGALLELVEHRF